MKTLDKPLTRRQIIITIAIIGFIILIFYGLIVPIYNLQKEIKEQNLYYFYCLKSYKTDSEKIKECYTKYETYKEIFN